MKNSSLYDILQNSVIGAIALHSFTVGFSNVARNKQVPNIYPRLEYFFYVLPIVYNQDALETFRSSTELYSALLKDNSIILGLQERANKMTSKTFNSLNLAFSKKILTYNKETKSIEPLWGFQSKKLPLPLSISSDDYSVKKIQDTAFRLGAIFAKRDPSTIQFELNILF